MKFRTEIEDKDSNLKINHRDSMLALGSCFVERIGGRLKANKFDIEVNPLGIAYQPLALLRHIEIIKSQQIPELHQHNGLWHSFDLHSQFSSVDKKEIKNNILEKIKYFQNKFNNKNIFIFTWGTAWIYQWKKNGELVANCHKYPAASFDKKLLSVDKITEAYAKFINGLSPDNQILISISPVRHAKDTLPLNAVSKSVLRLAAHQLCESFEQVHYFPAYEIMLDDLRDYRFYGSDLVHPTEMGEDYIWQKFISRYCDIQTRKLIQDWTKIQQGLKHRPFQPQGPQYQKHLESLLKKIFIISEYIDCQQEILEVEALLEV